MLGDIFTGQIKFLDAGVMMPGWCELNGVSSH